MAKKQYSNISKDQLSEISEKQSSNDIKNESFSISEEQSPHISDEQTSQISKEQESQISINDFVFSKEFQDLCKKEIVTAVYVNEESGEFVYYNRMIGECLDFFRKKGLILYKCSSDMVKMLNSFNRPYTYYCPSMVSRKQDNQQIEDLSNSYDSNNILDSANKYKEIIDSHSFKGPSLIVPNALRNYMSNTTYEGEIENIYDDYDDIIREFNRKELCGYIDEGILKSLGYLTEAEIASIENEKGLKVLQYSFVLEIPSIHGSESNDHECLNTNESISNDPSTNNSDKQIKNHSTKIKWKEGVFPTTDNQLENYALKCAILILLRQNDEKGFGWTQTAIRDMTGASIGNVNEVCKMYEIDPNLNPRDLFPLKKGPKPNPYGKISKEIVEELLNICSEKSPVDLGLNYPSWSAAAFLTYFDSKGINVTLPYIYNLCQRLHVTSKFAILKNPKQDDFQVEFFKTEGFRQIAKQCIEDDSILLFVDECHVLITNHFRGFSRVNTRTVCAYTQNTGHSMYSIVTFIGLNGFHRVFLIEGSFTSEKMIECLNTIKKENKDKKFKLIMDNCGVHTSNEVLGWLSSNKRRFSAQYIPPYAPKLNVVEYFNNTFKKDLKKTAIMTKEQLLERATYLVELYNKNTEEITNKMLSYFKNKECKYIQAAFDAVKAEYELDKASND